jgi:hypothetical protein
MAKSTYWMEMKLKLIQKLRCLILFLGSKWICTPSMCTLFKTYYNEICTVSLKSKSNLQWNIHPSVGGEAGVVLLLQITDGPMRWRKVEDGEVAPGWKGGAVLSRDSLGGMSSWKDTCMLYAPFCFNFGLFVLPVGSQPVKQDIHVYTPKMQFLYVLTCSYAQNV